MTERDGFLAAWTAIRTASEDIPIQETWTEESRWGAIVCSNICFLTFRSRWPDENPYAALAEYRERQKT